MTDIVERLRNGICQDQYDDIEIYETEQMTREAADRIEALEARIAAADALAVILAAAMHEHDTANYEYGEENPWTMQEWFSDEDRAALAAYQATKEGE